jgi:coenzyme F420-reducing hydrogenase alpha subunit
MSRSIHVPALARVEGEGALHIALKDGQVAEVRLDIYEPPRFFEGFLRGRHLQEVPDITARICGICPVAYQMSAVRALEKALHVDIPKPIRDLRVLFYCAEWIESHALHVYMLQAPDLFQQDSALSLAKLAPEVVQRGLRMKKIGNALLAAIGGRSVHPVSACVGGFYRWPEEQRVRGLLPDLRWGLQAAVETVRWAAGLDFPHMEGDYLFVALHNPLEYAILDGQVRSSDGKTLSEEAFEGDYLEQQVPHSNALHSRTRQGQTYMVGPLARLNINFDQLGPAAREAAREIGLRPPLRNPYKAMLARALEMVEAFDRAIRLVEDYRPRGPIRLALPARPGEGAAATEAPRGLLYHRYRVDERGLIQEARIVPPTAQNLARIEADLWELAPRVVDLPLPQATLACEHLIRAYDPCISCATHFLKLRIHREA